MYIYIMYTVCVYIYITDHSADSDNMLRGALCVQRDDSMLNGPVESH